ncbi:tripartite ATP-independent transporter DctP family solute receptor [Salsuginibacillus halophilus]|uniref:Tripartite ATP-independent transporter DctP family solute receptor n=1 Tax=Salsuginibacillus halophilus TaxID=517424 RepID=A0A2P8HL90_9BACI|nr:DctP family TRAP transporter solute-binding subunit [Salsuginibacillus halophilus]PSL46989.1 tripartite ATP-independent transporter DctP family solute receptor [Salsuginibacillus halophilus]
MKKLAFGAMTMAVMGTLAACGDNGAENEASGSAEDTGETHEIRVAHLVNEDQSTHVALEEFIENVEARSDGQLQVEAYPNGSLYVSDREAIEAVQTGNLEMTIPAVAPLSGFNSSFMVFDLPFLFETKDAAYSALDGDLGNTLLDELEEDNLKGLAFAENGFRHITNNNGPIEDPDDLEGMSLRTMENPVHTDTFQALGANASPFAFGELYTALQQGTYDAMESPVSLVYTNNFYEVQDYLTVSEHFYAATILLTNPDFFDDLPEDLQEIIQEEADNYREEQRQIASEQDEEWMEELEDEMEINELSEEQKEQFIEQTSSVYEDYEEEIGSDLIEMAREANE